MNRIVMGEPGYTGVISAQTPDYLPATAICY